MKQIKVFYILMVMLSMYPEILQAAKPKKVAVNKVTDAQALEWAKNNVAEIAKALWTEFAPSRSEPVTFDDIVRYLPASVENAMQIQQYDNYFSLDQKNMIVGIVQAELDQSDLAFSGKSLPSDKSARLTEYEQAEAAMRSWIQKKSDKIIKYFNNQKITSVSDFDAIAQACTALNIALPKTDLSAMEQEVLIDQINAGLELLNADASFRTLNYKKTALQLFDDRQTAYISDYLIPKLVEAGYESITLSDLDAFLEALSKQNMTALRIQIALHKAQPVIQDDFIKELNNILSKDPKFAAIKIQKAFRAHRAKKQQKVQKIVLVLKAIYEILENSIIASLYSIISGPSNETEDKTVFVKEMKEGVSADKASRIEKALKAYQKEIQADPKVKAADKKRMNSNCNWILGQLVINY